MRTLLLWILLSGIAAIIAAYKGRSPATVFVASMILTPFLVLPVIIILPANTRRLNEEGLRSGALKKCLKCEKLNTAAATECAACERPFPVIIEAEATFEPENKK
jgi:hypothetical protein